MVLVIFTFSCTGKREKNDGPVYEPNGNFDQLQADFQKWWIYHNKYISLSSDFTGYSEKAETISKNLFLEKLASGRFIPLRLKSTEGAEVYKLYPLVHPADESIVSTIKNEAITSLVHLNLEGQSFPSFDLTDLNKNHYTNASTEGKYLILKTWFIGCAACVAEFPELNELVGQFRNREDVLFISLATDSPSALEAFLQRKEFDYQVIPDQKELIVNKLKLQEYPTHIVVDQKGTILKVVNKASEMISFLENKQIL